MRHNVKFLSKGILCRGWLYVPEIVEHGKKAPGIVMAHGFAAVKEMGLAGFAEHFQQSGFAVLVFDYRFWGDSEGEPRNQVFALEMAEDYRNGITWISKQAEVDPDRIGIWGTSYSGGICLHVATHDNRVKAVVAQIPSTLTPEARRDKDTELWDVVGRKLTNDRIDRYETGNVHYMNVVAPEGEPCVFPDKDAYEFYMGYKDAAPNWSNKVSLESLEKVREFDPVSMIHLLAPTALLLITGENDGLIPIEEVERTYARALQPKALSKLPITHFLPYKEPWLPKVSDLAIQWFREHL